MDLNLTAFLKSGIQADILYWLDIAFAKCSRVVLDIFRQQVSQKSRQVRSRAPYAAGFRSIQQLRPQVQ